MWPPINCLYYILIRNLSRGFFGALTTNMLSDLEISKINNGGSNIAAKMLFILCPKEKFYKGVSWGAIHESVIEFLSF